MPRSTASSPHRTPPATVEGADPHLVAAARGAGLPLLTGHVAVDALRAADGTVAGVTVLDDAGRPGMLHAPAVLLATGGYGQLFASTTNPATSTGDGVALALRAGATAADIDKLCDEARTFGFAAVCVNPAWVARCAGSRTAGRGRCASRGCRPSR